MRTKNNGTVILKYPDEIGFAFNPCLLVLTGTNIVSMSIVMRCGGISHAYTVEAINGTVYADVREFVQSFFDGMSTKIDYTAESSKTEQGKVVEFSVSYTDADSTTHDAAFTFTVFYVWGAMHIGEIYNGMRHLKMFPGYPFTFGLYKQGEARSVIVLSPNSTPRQMINLSGQGIFNLTCNQYEDYDHIVVTDYKGTFTRTTFSDTYDLTFRYTFNGTCTKMLYIDIDHTAHTGRHLYLRWINRHGFVCYWLFKTGIDSRAVSTDSQFIRNNLHSWDDAYGYRDYNNRQQSYKREDTINICAPLVDSDTFNFLQDLTTSPVVDLWLGDNNWQTVTVKAGTYSKSGEDLQNFEAQIILPEYALQSL